MFAVIYMWVAPGSPSSVPGSIGSLQILQPSWHIGGCERQAGQTPSCNSRPVPPCMLAAAAAPPLLTAPQHSDVAPSWHGVSRCTLREGRWGRERGEGHSGARGLGCSLTAAGSIRTREEVSKGISSGDAAGTSQWRTPKTHAYIASWPMLL